MMVSIKLRIALLVLQLRSRLLDTSGRERSRLTKRMLWAEIDSVTASYNFLRWTWAGAIRVTTVVIPSQSRLWRLVMLIQRNQFLHIAKNLSH